MIFGIEIADEVFLSLSAVLGALLVAAVSYTANVLWRTTTTIDRIDRAQASHGESIAELKATVYAHIDESKDLKIQKLEREREKLEMELAEARA